MKYFAYGSNMSQKRLQKRISSPQSIGVYFLAQHKLRFHKISTDGSGKCDAYYTGNTADSVIGVLYEIDELEKPILDKFEFLGYGYNEKEVLIADEQGNVERAITYYALKIDASLLPYSWYKEHVLFGARKAQLPTAYIEEIESIATKKDLNQERAFRELKIYGVDLK
ncbi:Gamma-glutamylcyclotransferase [Hyella patelloides LEGE 07179]|uniref:Gamma-glutamylcyclotransferase n=1 Tax=Hyella patelloides LEGE 07179 TaxID=945734 RepID=A0A563VIM8_9CYAN|nr:gamma-glutamylcyclotransferase family protein [Hyella patelloides]VEP11288.1 Gamma-glutamylcyclotransferase [Hyella patelloides LEGE 07179]